MELLQIWNDVYPAVCSITCHKDNVQVGSGTGFLVRGRLVTNHHNVPTMACQVHLRFMEVDGCTVRKVVQLSSAEFRERCLMESWEAAWDFAVFSTEGLEDFPNASLTLSDRPALIGEAIALAGFHFDRNNLAIHAGFLSSTLQTGAVTVLQLDASVNNGNSGGPLIRLDDGSIIGIVTRKATGLTKAFADLQRNLEENIRILTAPSLGIVSLGGLDPRQALAATQQQLGLLSREIERSANVGIGYAFSISKVAEALRSLDADRH